MGPIDILSLLRIDMIKPFLFDVWECGHRIGTISRHHGHHYDFVYDPEYIELGGHELCATMPISNKVYASDGLHPFFKNYISEGWLEEVQKTYTGGMISPETQSADMIAYFGQNCIGGISFRPCQPFSPEPADVLTDLEIQIANKKSMLPGAHPKVLAVEVEKGKFRIPREDERSTHIAKLPRSEKKLQTLLYNEYLTTLVVAALLPDDPVCEMEFGKLKGVEQDVLFIKRFDRGSNGEKIPFYEFNQLLGKTPDEKYDGSYRQMADYIAEHAVEGGKGGITCDRADLRVLFRRIAISVLVGNSDAHLKNFALMAEGDKMRLTPNYDLVSVSMYAGYKDVALEVGDKSDWNGVALELGGKRVFIINRVDAKRIIGLADEYRLSRPELLEDVRMIEKNLAAAYKVLDEHQDKAPAVADYIRRFLKARWNNAFAPVEKVLKNPPTNLLYKKRAGSFVP